MHPVIILEKYWNYTSFKPLQEEIINSILGGHDTFALLPTGGGKSVCYQIPALIKEGICIVISPLIALMKDQVNQLHQRGIKAMALTSGIAYNELDTLLDNCIYGNYKFLYVSPERLQQNIVRERIQKMNVNLIAVDEAHCISQWGHDFRPAYRQIVGLRELKPQVPILALTATATDKVAKDIIEHLDFISPKIFKSSFARPNISFQVIETEDKFYEINQLLKNNTYSSIIYVRTRKHCTQLHEYLEKNNLSSDFYHGGLNAEEKQSKLIKWTKGQVLIMVATTAFGMGIDNPNVNMVIHFGFPESIESYYQEAGRAGRNGQYSKAVILNQNNDTEILKQQFINYLPSIKFIKEVYLKLNRYFRIAYGEGQNTEHQFSFAEFSNQYHLKPRMTYNVLQILDRNSIISLDKNFENKVTVKFLTNQNKVFQYIEKQPKSNKLIKVLLRTYGGIFDYDTSINLSVVAKKIESSEKEVFEKLQLFEQDKLISLISFNTDSTITFLRPREDEKTINCIAKNILAQHKIKQQQVEAVLAYINNKNQCRSIQLLNYFGENSNENCGICTYCESKKHTNKIDKDIIKEKIVEALKNQQLNSRALAEILNFEKNVIINGLRRLIEEEKIESTINNKFKLK